MFARRLSISKALEISDFNYNRIGTQTGFLNKGLPKAPIK